MQKKQDTPEEPKVLLPYGYLPHCETKEDGIDLRELWAILKKRKRTVLGSVFFALFAAWLYLLYATPWYESKVTLEIGKQLLQGENGTLTEKYFDNARAVKEYLDVKYDTVGKYREKNTTAYIDSVTVPKKDETFLTLRAMGKDNNASLRILSRAMNEVLAKHRVYYETVLTKKKDDAETVRQQIAYHLETELPKLRKNLELLKSVELKKIEKKIALVRSLDIKKLEEKIDYYKRLKIPALRKKMDENEKEIAQKRASIEKMTATLGQVIQKDPALATMTAMQIASLQNDIARLKERNIDLDSEIKSIEEETVPDLRKQIERIRKERLFNLEAEKTRLLEEKIPEQQARIDQLLHITVPKLHNRLEHIKTSMKPPYLTQTRIVGKIFTHNAPVKPKTKLVLAVALITGLIIGIFFAFLLEFPGKERQES